MGACGSLAKTLVLESAQGMWGLGRRPGHRREQPVLEEATVVAATAVRTQCGRREREGRR